MIISGVWNSIRTPVTKDILFQVVEVERFMPPQKQPSELMPPPAKMPRRWQCFMAYFFFLNNFVYCASSNGDRLLINITLKLLVWWCRSGISPAGYFGQHQLNSCYCILFFRVSSKAWPPHTSYISTYIH